MKATRVDGTELPNTTADTLRDLMAAAALHKGQIRGHCLILLIDDGDGSSSISHYRSWESRTHLIGTLEIVKDSIIQAQHGESDLEPEGS